MPTRLDSQSTESPQLSRSPDRTSSTWHFLLLYLAGIGALWDVGHPVIVLGSILGIPLMAAVRYRLPVSARKVCQHVICLFGVLWGLSRLNGAPAERLLVETMFIIGSSFIIAPGDVKSGYLLSISSVVIIFGCLGSPRIVHIIMIVPTVLLLLYLLHTTRLSVLSVSDSQHAAKVRLRWHPSSFILWIICMLMIWPSLFRFMPLRSPMDSPDMQDPLEHQTQAVATWLRQLLRVRPPMSGERAVAPEDSGDRGRFGQLGTDLVMRVKSPIRVYWLAALYDQYNGDSWLTSRQLKNQPSEYILSDVKRGNLSHFEQTFTIEKWFSPILYTGFLSPRAPMVNGSGVRITSAGFSTSRIPAGAVYPKLPFSYVALSYLPDSESQSLCSWYEKIPKSAYTKLPEISARIYRLTHEICSDANTPYDKALAIRNHLRHKYSYSLKTKPVPSGRESVDYFLFEMDAGHCEYFASAMAVMARCAGLPSRVATGFAPGKFNPLRNEFEVYEYHAHAWAQVFIDGKGWLTMDGTPGGAEQIAEKRSFLSFSSWHNPFSDDWRIKTPELSADISHQRELHRAADKLKMDQVQRGILLLKLQNRLLGIINPQKKRAAARLDRQYPHLTLKRTITLNLKQAYNDAVLWLERVHRHLSLREVFFCLAICLVGLVGLYALPRFIRLYQFHHELRTCSRMIVNADTMADEIPDELVQLCYTTSCRLLGLAGLSRHQGEDLFDYATSMHPVSRDLSRHLLGVFRIYQNQLYSPASTKPSEAKEALGHARKAVDILMDLITKSQDGLRLG